MRRLSFSLCLVMIVAACGAGEADTPAADESVATTIPATTLPATAVEPPTTTTLASPATTSPPATDSPTDPGNGAERTEDGHDDGPTPADQDPGSEPPPEKPPARTPEPVEAVAPGSGGGEVPAELLTAILDHAAETTGNSPEAFTVVQAEQVVWSDGSLGCPEPGVMYTQALVDGFLVVVDDGTARLEYHAAASGGFTLCQPFRDKPVAP